MLFDTRMVMLNCSTTIIKDVPKSSQEVILMENSGLYLRITYFVLFFNVCSRHGIAYRIYGLEGFAVICVALLCSKYQHPLDGLQSINPNRYAWPISFNFERTELCKHEDANLSWEYVAAICTIPERFVDSLQLSLNCFDVFLLKNGQRVEDSFLWLIQYPNIF